MIDTSPLMGSVLRGPQVLERDEAVREVYLAHYGRLAGWCAHLAGDKELGHEFATEAFTRLLTRWRTVEDPKPWLYMTAANLVRDHWRRTERERRAFRRVAAEPGVQPAADPGIRDVVDRLPDRLRTVVLLHYYADLPVREVARVLGKAEGTVKRALFDARARLLADLEDSR
jgi:RNA polymerase sigma-70 factor (ECF subfamily)